MKITAARFDHSGTGGMNFHEPFTLIAGENGCGKSSLLRHIAASSIKRGKKVLAVSGTPFHRFGELKIGVNLLAPGGVNSKPETVLKRTISRATKTDEIRLRTLSRVLRHCGYYPEIGIQVVPPKRRSRISRDDVLREAQREHQSEGELLSLIAHLQGSVLLGDTEWLDFDGHHYGQAIRGILANVVYWEGALKRLGVIGGVKLHLQNGRRVLPLDKASSGELSLITSLAFIAVSANGADVILIDEPENSLHPKWQREYMELLIGAIGYENPKVVIATHAPLLVMAASESQVEVQTLVLSNSFKDRLEIESASLEEVLAEVFNTYSPRNNYLSKTLVKLMDSVESGKISAEEANRSLVQIKSSGVDETQESALNAVSEIVAKMVSEP